MTANSINPALRSELRSGRVFRGFDQECFAFREQSDHGSPFAIVERDLQ